jgi:hypothetical protein
LQVWNAPKPRHRGRQTQNGREPKDREVATKASRDGPEPGRRSRPATTPKEHRVKTDALLTRFSVQAGISDVDDESGPATWPGWQRSEVAIRVTPGTNGSPTPKGSMQPHLLRLLSLAPVPATMRAKIAATRPALIPRWFPTATARFLHSNRISLSR